MMKKMKVLTLTLIGTVLLVLGGCTNNLKSGETNTSVGSKPTVKTTGSEAETAETVKIGIIQYVQHEALDAARKGFIDGLAEAGYEDGKNIAIDYENAQADQSNTSTIADKFVSDKKDLILAVATPAAQAVANKTAEIPILITAVTDPASAGLVKANDIAGGNVSGTSDLNPVREQVELLKNTLPQVKKVALLYSSAEDNSRFQIALAKKYLDAAGITYTDATVQNTNDVQSVVESLVGKADAIYTPTDNIIASSMSVVSKVATDAKIPVFAGEEALVNNGALATYGIDYYALGKQTAAMAVKLLKGEAKITEMPIEYPNKLTLTVNPEIEKALNLKVPTSQK
ncbi:MAG: ABC transporter substrate-binding protein [Lachnospiraceae bacterium]|nr:ABC transporter substrate-binding protein [Lachnospiraceae bacterium]